MVPSSARITNGDPALAQPTAQSLLIGFFRSLVKAHAESKTQPFTEIAFPDFATDANVNQTTSAGHSMRITVFSMFMFGALPKSDKMS